MDRRQELVMTAVTAGDAAAVAWAQIPPWQRQIIMRAMRRQAWRMLHRLARASGHRAMGDELAGRQSEADAGYSFTERLSRARDRLLCLATRWRRTTGGSTG